MNEQGFVDRRDGDWIDLAMLCDKADTNINRLTAAEMRDFIRLYRRVSTDLAVSRTQSTNIPLINHLNDLVGRAYGILYRAPRKPVFATLFAAIAICAQTVRRNKWFLATSAGIFFGSALFVYGLMNWVPSVHDQVIPPQMEELVKQWQKGQFDERSGSQSGMMAGFYASNNPRTSIITGAVGAGSFGIGSVALLFENGKMLGALAHEMSKVGKLGFLLTSISPHGVPELSGICVAGGSGLLLAYALINPGRRRRADALRLVGKDALVLLATSVVLMFIAAPIEGFFSFQPMVPQWVKGVVAVVSLFGWAVFWSSYARNPEIERHPLAED